LELHNSRILNVYEAAVRRSSTPSPQVLANNAEDAAELLKQPQREERTDLEESKIDGYEVSVMRARKTVAVRIRVDQGYAIPFLSLTIRPNVDTGPPYVEPYTLRSTQGRYGG